MPIKIYASTDAQEMDWLINQRRIATEQYEDLSPEESSKIKKLIGFLPQACLTLRTQSEGAASPLANTLLDHELYVAIVSDDGLSVDKRFPGDLDVRERLVQLALQKKLGLRENDSEPAFDLLLYSNFPHEIRDWEEVKRS